MSDHRVYLTRRQLLEKFPFLSENSLKNWLFKDVGGFRSRVVFKVGRKLLFSEEGMFSFLAANKDGGIHG